MRDYGLSLPFATERCPFGPDTLAFEIGGMMFCLMTLSGEWDFYNLKVRPDYGVELCERYSGIRPGFHMNKRHWISVDFRGDVPDNLQEELIFHFLLPDGEEASQEDSNPVSHIRPVEMSKR